MELKRTTTGKDICTFTVAAKDRDNYPAYIDCCAWEATAVDVSKYFAKDSQIIVMGKMRNNNYETKDGDKVRKLVCDVELWEFAGAKNDANEGPVLGADLTVYPGTDATVPTPNYSNAIAPQEDENNDLPF